MKPWPEKPAREIHAVAGRADDRMRVRRHVVEAGPGTHNGRVSRSRVPVRQPSAPVLDEGVVDGLGPVPPRRRLPHREPQPSEPTRRKWKADSSTVIGRSRARPRTGPTSAS